MWHNKRGNKTIVYIKMLGFGFGCSAPRKIRSTFVFFFISVGAAAAAGSDVVVVAADGRNQMNDFRNFNGFVLRR